MPTTTEIQPPTLTPELAELRERMNARQCRFVDALFGAEPLPAYRAYQLAYGQDIEDNYAQSMAARSVNHLEPVCSYVRAMKRRDWESNALSREEKRAFLADAVRTPIDQVVTDGGAIREEFGHLVQEVSQSTDRDGNPVTKVKLVGKAEALRIDNAMTGDDAPIKVEHSLSDLLSGLPSSVGLPIKDDA